MYIHYNTNTHIYIYIYRYRYRYTYMYVPVCVLIYEALPHACTSHACSLMGHCPMHAPHIHMHLGGIASCMLAHMWGAIAHVAQAPPRHQSLAQFFVDTRARTWQVAPHSRTGGKQVRRGLLKTWTWMKCSKRVSTGPLGKVLAMRGPRDLAQRRTLLCSCALCLVGS